MRAHPVPRLMLLALALALAACDAGAERTASGAGGTPADTPAGTPATAPADTRADAPAGGRPGGEQRAKVRIWLSRVEAPVSVERRVDAATPAAALHALVAGPTAEERTAGLDSWFSESTADVLASVVDREGFLVVDFRGLDRLIPNASSSAGSAMLLSALDSTVFQFPAVDSVEYRLDGSCDAFWEWLQRGCEVVVRP